jgi:hypothetical protein
MSVATISEPEAFGPSQFEPSQAEPSHAKEVARPAEIVPARVTLSIRPSRVWIVLSLIVIGLVIASTAGRVLLTVIDGDTYRGVREIAYRLDLDRENTLPAWFSSLLLFTCAAALAVVWRIRVKCRGEFVWRWAVLAAAFLYLSLDESASLHEILIEPLRRRMGWGGILYFSWVVPGAVIVLGFGLSYLQFWWRLPRGIRGRVCTAAVLYVGGAMGMELVGGALADAYGLHAMSYTIVMTIEESLEMVGLIVFLSALLELIRREAPSLSLQWLPARGV